MKHFSTKRKNSQYLYIFEKRNGLIHEDNINNAAVENNWYTLELSDNKLAWEEFYAFEIEPRYRIIAQLIETASSVLIVNRAKIIDNTIKAEIAILMIYQLFRGRTGIKYAKAFAEVVFPRIIDEAKDEIGDSILITRTALNLDLMLKVFHGHVARSAMNR